MNRFSCHHCGKHLSYRIDQLGKRIKCPKCQGVLKVGLQEAPENVTSAGFFSGLVAEGERRRLVMASGLLVVAAVMIWYAFFT